MDNFRGLIITLQQKAGISTYQLAKMAGIKSPATLYRYLAGKSSITVTNLNKVLGCLSGQQS